MAKTKMFAVDVEITVKRTLFVHARRPNGAVERLSTREGWSEATRYEEEMDVVRFAKLGDDAEIVRVREVGS
jgi:hypothetical protein